MGRPAELDGRPGRVGADITPLQNPGFAVPKVAERFILRKQVVAVLLVVLLRGFQGEGEGWAESVRAK